MATKKNCPPISKMSFEEALLELEKIVRTLEEGQNNLEDAVQAYERGVALREHCNGKLKDAEMRVEKITLDDKNEIEGSVPFPDVTTDSD